MRGAKSATLWLLERSLAGSQKTLFCFIHFDARTHTLNFAHIELEAPAACLHIPFSLSGNLWTKNNLI